MTRVGDALIETMRVRRGRLPLLERHFARLRSSLAALGRPVPGGDLAELVREAAGGGGGGGAGSGADHVVRLAVVDGVPSVTTRDMPSHTPPVVILAKEPHAAYPHKSTTRGAFDRALAEARAQRADDALLVTGGGHIAEGTTWSLFWWEGDRLCTPALDLGILPGVGRARVMELAEVVEVRVTLAAFAGRSLFLVNAVRGIVPIGLFRGRDVPLDARTAELSHRFWPD
jgi:branched-subunit amino acid aminotransferase/4-amino-4-deoxychorismate lyase